MTHTREGKPRRATGPGIAAWVLAAAGIAVFAAGCGGRRLAAGTVPFPAEKPVFIDADGHPLQSLPAAPEPLKLVVLDFPWCPPCAEAWKAVSEASKGLPPGSLRVYRILFDRERYFSGDGVGVVPPLRPAPRVETPDSAFPVTTLTAVPDAFRKEYEFEQAPLILLLSASGTVARSWIGYSPSLSASLVEEIGRARKPAQDSSASPPP